MWSDRPRSAIAKPEDGREQEGDEGYEDRDADAVYNRQEDLGVNIVCDDDGGDRDREQDKGDQPPRVVALGLSNRCRLHCHQREGSGRT